MRHDEWLKEGMRLLDEADARVQRIAAGYSGDHNQDMLDDIESEQFANRAVFANHLRAAPGREPAGLPTLPTPYTAQIMCGEDVSLYTADQMHAHAAAVAAALAAPGKPVGYLAAYEMDRLRSGHDARLRSPLFGPSELDCDVPVYAAPPDEPTAGREGANLPDCTKSQTAAYDKIDRYLRANLADDDYAGYLAALDQVYAAAPADAAQPAEPVIGEGELWSWTRSVMTHGVSIYQDYQGGAYSYEAYSARLDAAASERATEFAGRLAAPPAVRAQELEWRKPGPVTPPN